MTTTTAKNARYLVIAMLFLGWSLGNFDRFIINFAILDISKELQLTESLTGIVLSSFFAGYALMQIPGGWLADRFGYRKVLISTILVWSIFTVLTGAAWSFLSIIVIRFLFGVGEGSYFPPAASKGIANWFPVDERSKAMSIMLTSGSIMGVVAPIVGTYLMLALGWRDIFYIVGGAIGIVVALSFFFLVKEKNAPATEQVKAKTSKAPLREVLKTPMIWKLFIAYFSIYAVNWGGLTSWMPTYLSKVKGLELTAVGIYSAIPPFIGIFAMLCSGYVLDKMPQGRDKLIAGIFAIIAGIGLLFMANAPSMLIFTICQSVVTVMLSFNIILITSVPLKILPEAVVGTANGFINTGAQFAGVLTPMLIGFLVEAFGGSYSAAFTMLIGFTIVCAVSLFLIRPNKNKVIVNSPSINEIID